MVKRSWTVDGGGCASPPFWLIVSESGDTLEKDGGVGLTMADAPWLWSSCFGLENYGISAGTKVGADPRIPSVWAWRSSYVGSPKPLAGPRPGGVQGLPLFENLSGEWSPLQVHPFTRTGQAWDLLQFPEQECFKWKSRQYGTPVGDWSAQLAGPLRVSLLLAPALVSTGGGFEVVLVDTLMFASLGLALAFAFSFALWLSWCPKLLEKETLRVQKSWFSRIVLRAPLMVAPSAMSWQICRHAFRLRG